MTLQEAQQALQTIITGLRGIDAELAELSISLPEPTQEFEARAELGGVIRCVRADLLADAIATLEHAGSQGPLGLCVEFHDRQSWLGREL